MSEQTPSAVFAYISGDDRSDIALLKAQLEHMGGALSRELSINAEAERTISRLTVALQAIADGDEPRPLGKRYRSDGKPSKHDKCTHGQWMWEDCGSCVSEFARAALATPAVSDADREGGS